MVFTDHGQQALNYPSTFSHGGPSELERTSFVFAAGPGIAAGATNAPGVVDIAPTVLHQLGLAVNPDVEPGRSLVRRRRCASRPPGGAGAAALAAPGAGAGRGGGQGRAGDRRPAPEPAPRADTAGGARARVNGRRAGRGRVKVTRRALAVTPPPGAGGCWCECPFSVSRTRPRTVGASVTEAGDVALGRRIAVTRRR